MAKNQRLMPRPSWSPQQDVDQSLAYSDPVQQNRALINESRNNRTNIMGLSEWQDYDAVLKGRGVGRFGASEEPPPSAPAGYTPGQLEEENTAFVQSKGQQLPRYAQGYGAQMLPNSQQAASISLQALLKASKGQR